MSGLTREDVRCHKPYNAHPEIVCHYQMHRPDIGRAFNYNPNTNRFIYTFVGTSAYLGNGSDTDVIYAGTCQQF